MNEPTNQLADDPRRGRSGVRRLAFSVFLLALVWTVALPWLASRPPIDSHVRWLNERGIDPSAMYYTELEAMKPILKRLNERERRARRGAGERPALGERPQQNS